ncbi:MAG TPA: ribose-phosphate diphosphokinase [Chthonomonadaceae bacterium]|nr:ribose-phosphate diphosphokinase [Chthonomonadaceae bacterium]
MLLFILPPLERMARELACVTGLERGRFTCGRFPNGELYMSVDSPVSGQPCMALGSISPPDENLLSTLLLCHTLAKEKGVGITALLPYLAYARQDRVEAGKSLGSAWVGEMLWASNVDEVVAFDVHSAAIYTLYPVPLRSLSPAPLFAAKIKELGLQEATPVAPDEGAIQRCEEVREAACMPVPVAYLEKSRTPEGVRHSLLHGQAGRQAIVVDDILDTGSTLVSCCEQLQRAGVQEITVFVTHGLFTGTLWQKLWSLAVRRIYCTDTVALPPEVLAAPVTCLSIAPLLKEFLIKAAA